MRFVTKILALILLSAGLMSLGQPLQAARNYAELQQQADGLYEAGDYDPAFRAYLKLAKKGDKFSQYRVSFMYLEGLGKESDIIESFAWAALAAEDLQEELVEYRNAVSALVPENKRRKAERKIDYYMRRWGNLALADNATRRARKDLRDCTGSRLGTRCEEIYTQQMPNYWGVAPGGANLPSGAISSPRGGAGGAVQNVTYYQDVRQSIRDLNQYIEQNSGRVDLGELEVIEDPAATPDDS